MKKFLLTAVLLISLSEIFALTTQGSWRWRNDDGSQITATWKAGQNVPITVSSTTETLRLRIELYNDAANPGGLLTDGYFECTTDNINWDTLKTVADRGQPFVLVGTSPNVTNLEPTTQQLASPHNPSFVAGKVIVSSTKLPAQTVAAGKGTEYEYVFKPTANMKPSTKYYFRVDAANYLSTSPLPTLTTDQALGVSLVSFKVQKDGKKVALKWSTASEQNNDRFVVERSNNLIDWKTVATIKGNGTSNEAHNYYTDDVNPTIGLNYYRLKQYDLDGKFTVSEIRSLQFILDKLAALSVFPNPVKDIINFKINVSGVTNLVVSLVNTSGTIIHQEKIESIEDGRSYQLNLQQKPAAGMYFLNVKSTEINENIKIVIQ